MPRSVNLVASHERRKKIRQRARGYYGARSRLLRTMRPAVRRAGQYSYEHRRKRPGMFRRLWIMRINAACRESGLNYSTFIHGLLALNIDLDRKVLAELAAKEPAAFRALAEKVSAAL
jgi:large subunit ribosomal protein L20